MVGPFLYPVARGTSMIDVVAVGVRLPRSKIGSLHCIAIIIPILLETHFSRYAKRADDFTLTAICGAAAADDEVAFFSCPSYLWFACRQRTDSMKRIWSKPVIA